MSEAAMRLPGQRLRAEREARGMSQEEAARRLNLTVTYVEALEADDYERLPEAAFVKGYIRNYARELELPGDELASVYAEMMVEEAEEVPERVEVMPSAARRRWLPLALGGVGVLVVVIALVLWQSGGAGPAPKDDSGSSGAPVAGQPGPDQSAPAPQPADAGAGDGETRAAPAPEEQGQGEPGSRSEPGTMANGQTEGEAGGAATADHLMVTFSGECWVRVTDAEGRKLFEGRRDSGAPLSLTGTAPFSVRFGDASVVDAVTVNDRKVAVPTGTPGQVVRMSVAPNPSE